MMKKLITNKSLWIAGWNIYYTESSFGNHTQTRGKGQNPEFQNWTATLRGTPYCLPKGLIIRSAVWILSMNMNMNHRQHELCQHSAQDTIRSAARLFVTPGRYVQKKVVCRAAWSDLRGWSRSLHVEGKRSYDVLVQTPLWTHHQSPSPFSANTPQLSA